VSRRRRVALGLAAVTVLVAAVVVVVALRTQDRIRETPDGFPRAEPALVAERAPFPERFGVNVDQVQTRTDRAFRRRQFRAIADAGLDWVRINIAWSQLERQEGALDLSALDAVVGDAADAGLAMNAILLFTPTWASTLAGSDRTPAADPALTDRFVRTVVERYGPDGSFWDGRPDDRVQPVRLWEIWNEPNVRHFFAPMSGTTYGHHAVVVGRAIRSVDPGARILFGGMAGHLDARGDLQTADSFLRDAVKAQPSLPRLLDGVALHVYRRGKDASRVACAIRGVMVETGFGDGIMALNEFGWPTKALGSLPEDERATAIGETVGALVDPASCPVPIGADLIGPYTWWSVREDDGRPDEWFGLADDAGRPTPAGLVYLQAAAGAERAYPRSREDG
jgi:hypothetical protein